MRDQLRTYSRADRIEHLHAFAEACGGAGALVSEHGPSDWGRAYASLADGARRLLDDGFTEADLRHLAVSVPGRLPWLHPKYPDYNNSRQPWQEEAARYVEKADRLALELRAVGSYDG